MIKPNDEWKRLREKARTPFEIKSAIFTFMERFGRVPESSNVLPEILREASTFELTNDERNRLIKLSENRLSIVWELPTKNSRPELLVQINPLEKKEINIMTPLIMSKEPTHLIDSRNALLQVKNNEKQS